MPETTESKGLGRGPPEAKAVSTNAPSGAVFDDFMNPQERLREKTEKFKGYA